ncbi:prepilin-type N-terminal cleavage/methylation domain-containing protein [Candidatus Kaiserbacteria bacterium]|nr:prepilin-type N-terminal cleavage/methylation domain-containing protein [Candidatus Kaiserbacteria bacterium]
MKKILASKKAFSLPEILLVVVLLGIVSAVSVPLVFNLLESGHRELAKSVAHSMNAAKHSFTMRQYNAEQLYAHAINDVERYQLIQPYLPGSGDTSDTLLPEGYHIRFHALLKQKVELTGPEGLIVY